LVEESERTLTEVARSLGIHGSMLRRWRTQVRKGGGQAFAESGRQERSELQRLQRENKRLQRDLEMLKTTIADIRRSNSAMARPGYTENFSHKAMSAVSIA
jgi:transposase